MRVLVTGATGFVGGFVARRLVDASHEVRALRRDPSRANDMARGVDWVTGDVLDPASLRAATSGCAAVVHCAAAVGFGRAQRDEQRRINVDGTRELIAAAKEAGVKRFVLTSSLSALGRPVSGLGTEDTRYDWPPGMPYHESKRDSEALALAAARDGMEVVSLNPGLVLGPGDAHVGKLLRAIKYRLLRVVPPGGLTLCDVRDVADAHVAALTRGRSGERYVLGGIHAHYRDIADAFGRALGVRGAVAVLPRAALRFLSVPIGLVDQLLPLPIDPANVEQLLVDKFYSCDKAIAELGYRTRELDESARDTVAWYREQGRI